MGSYCGFTRSVGSGFGDMNRRGGGQRCPDGRVGRCLFCVDSISQNQRMTDCYSSRPAG